MKRYIIVKNKLFTEQRYNIIANYGVPNYVYQMFKKQCWLQLSDKRSSFRKWRKKIAVGEFNP
jgi:hypothetical protein